MSVTSNERMAPELSQFIIDKYQNMDASKQKEFLGIINEINATYAPFKRRTAILLRELVALADASLIDVRELFAFSDVKLEYPSEQAKDLADALETLPESIRLKILDAARSMLSEYFVLFSAPDSKEREISDKYNRLSYLTIDKNIPNQFVSLTDNDFFDGALYNKLYNVIRRLYPRSAYLHSELRDHVLFVMRYNKVVRNKFKPTIEFSSFNIICSILKLSPHWLLGLTDTTCLLSDERYVDPIIDAFLLMPTATQIAFLAAVKSIRNHPREE